MPPAKPRSYEQGVDDGRRDALVETLHDGLRQIQQTTSDGLRAVHERLNAMEKDNCKPRADRLTKVETSVVWIRRIVAAVGTAIMLGLGWLIYIVIERKA